MIMKFKKSLVQMVMEEDLIMRNVENLSCNIHRIETYLNEYDTGNGSNIELIREMQEDERTLEKQKQKLNLLHQDMRKYFKYIMEGKGE